MISKELLSEVLNLNITYIERCNNSIIYKISVYDREEEVNVYELAYKCKEWAIHKSYHLHSSLRHHKLRGLSKLVIGDDIEYFEAETEPESIFLACQWILENKDNK